MDRSDIEFTGGCTVCHECDGYFNYESANWCFCNTHKKVWLRGINLLTSWKFETEEDWLKNFETYKDFEIVEPFIED